MHGNTSLAVVHALIPVTPVAGDTTTVTVTATPVTLAAAAAPVVVAVAAPVVVAVATVPSPLAPLHAAAHGSSLICPVPGCGTSLSYKSRTCLAKHLATKHSVGEATPTLLATHALARCPAVGCAAVCCILPRDTSNGWSSFFAHTSSCRECPAHVALRTSVHGVATGTWGAAETALRCAAVAIAPPGSIGAALATIPSVRHPTATAAAAATMIGAAAAATCATTALTGDDDEPDAN